MEHQQLAQVQVAKVRPGLQMSGVLGLAFVGGALTTAPAESEGIVGSGWRECKVE